MLVYKLKTPYNPGDLDPGVVYDQACVCDLRVVANRVNVSVVLGRMVDDVFVAGRNPPRNVVLRNSRRDSVTDYSDVEAEADAFTRVIMRKVVALDESLTEG